MSVENGPGEGTWAAFAELAVAQRDEVAARHGALFTAMCRVSADAQSLGEAQQIARRAMDADEREADEDRDVGLWERADNAERAAARLESERDSLRTEVERLRSALAKIAAPHSSDAASHVEGIRRYATRILDEEPQS